MTNVFHDVHASLCLDREFMDEARVSELLQLKADEILNIGMFGVQEGRRRDAYFRWIYSTEGRVKGNHVIEHLSHLLDECATRGGSIQALRDEGYTIYISCYVLISEEEPYVGPPKPNDTRVPENPAIGATLILDVSTLSRLSQAGLALRFGLYAM